MECTCYTCGAENHLPEGGRAENFYCWNCGTASLVPAVTGGEGQADNRVGGAVAGAVIGGAMGGPAGALVGGLIGLIVGSNARRGAG